MKKIIYLFIATLLLFAGCSEDNPLEPSSSEQIVVRGYLYAGEAVWDIHVSSTLPLGSEELQTPPINNAIVSLKKDDATYTLSLSEGDSGYYHYDGDNLTIEPGNEFEIQVEYNAEVVTGKTIVPFPPENITASSNTITIPEEMGFGSMNDETGNITITWQEDESSLFYLVIECTEENPSEIPSRMPGGDMFRKKFVFPPTNNNDYIINRRRLSYYGTHIVKVYRVNQEYADLYESRTQDSRDLNEPLTNIENGLGIFSAFASRSVSFNVVPE